METTTETSPENAEKVEHNEQINEQESADFGNGQPEIPKVIGKGKAPETLKPATETTPPSAISETTTETPGTTITTTTTGLTDDQLKAHFESIGLPWEGMDKIKEKLTYQPPAAELTPEQKEAQEVALDSRMLNKYLTKGGKPEDYVGIKTLAKTDVAQISDADLRAELKTAGFNADEISNIIRERYYQIDDTELEGIEDDDEKEFLKRKKEFFAGKMANRSSHKQAQAQAILDSLKGEIEAEDNGVNTEKNFSSQVEKHFSSVPRTQSVEVGTVKLGDKEIAFDPIQYDIPEADLAEIKETLKDPAKRQQLFFNEDGTLDLNKVTNILVANKALKSAVAAGIIQGGNKQIAFFNEIFPADSPFALGTGGVPQKRETDSGKIVRRGNVRVPQTQN